MSSRSKSRKKTPWDDQDDLTETQRFLRMHYVARYEQRHPNLKDSDETDMINSYVPRVYPYCGSEDFIRKGHDNIGIMRYKCFCGKYFKPTTGTIFESRKIPICEWIEYCLNIFRYLSLNADSWNNRNAISTSKYWLEKLFLTVENTQDSVVLSGDIWLDETYYPLIMRDKTRNDDGTFLRGLSRNQICIGVATDKKNTICYFEGYGKPNQKRSFETFKDHIQPGSTLIHDKEATHRKLIKELSLKSVCYSSSELKKLADSENPLNPVNRTHNLLKMFLNAHSGFNREDLQGYLNLYSFVINAPEDHLEKVEKIINLVFENPKSLRYRRKSHADT
jgi:transposase-like protein